MSEWKDIELHEPPVSCFTGNNQILVTQVLGRNRYIMAAYYVKVFDMFVFVEKRNREGPNDPLIALPGIIAWRELPAPYEG